MSARLRSDIWVSAWLRRCAVANIPAVLRRRGAPEAGAIFIKLDLLNGFCRLYGPAFQGDAEQDNDGRLFRCMHAEDAIAPLDAENIMAQEIRFDPDLWLLESDDRQGRLLADVARKT